ncbi:MAG: ribosome-binding factor A [bacterium]
MKIKDQKIGDALKAAAGDFIQRNSNMTSLITVTRVELEDRGGRATIFVTVFPEDKGKGALDMLKRKRSEFRESIPSKIRIGRIPFCDFELDASAKLLRTIENLPENK